MQFVIHRLLWVPCCYGTHMATNERGKSAKCWKCAATTTQSLFFVDTGDVLADMRYHHVNIRQIKVQLILRYFIILFFSSESASNLSMPQKSVGVNTVKTEARQHFRSLTYRSAWPSRHSFSHHLQPPKGRQLAALTAMTCGLTK